MKAFPETWKADRIKRAIPAFIMTAILMPAPVPAFAAPTEAGALVDMPFEQLLSMEVYSASKFTQSLSEAPSVASVITAEDIRTFGWRTLAEALASVRGLYVTSDRNYDYLGARGFLRPGDYNSRFLLLIDGYRINDTVYDQAPIGSDFPLDLELVERIEYVPGPGSSVYGSNAFFGVINVISKPGKSLLGARARIDAGSFGERRAHASYGWQSAGGQRFVLSASDSRVSGPDLYYPQFERGGSDGVARNLDYDRAKKLMFKAEAGELTLTALYASRDKGIPTASFGQVFNDQRSHTVDTQSAIKLDYQSAVNEHSSVLLRAFHGRHDYVGTYAYDAPPLGLNVDGGRARWWGGEAKLVSTALARHKVVLGAEYQRDYHTEQYNYQHEPRAVYLADKRQRHRAAAYLQDEWWLREDLLLSTGLRYDMLTGVSSNLSPRLALIWKASEATTLKAIAGTAFRAPNVYELYYAVPGEGAQVPNPGLKPEHIRSFELALEHRPSSESRFTASAFRNEVRDLISQRADANGMLMFYNVDEVTAHGLELEAEKIWAGNLRLRSSYTWQRSRDAHTGQELVNSPRHLAKLNLSYRLNGWTRAGLETQYMSSRATMSARTGGYWLANGTLVHALSRSAELSASVYNLFNVRYADPGSGEHLQDTITRNGRTLRVSLNLWL